MLMDAGLQAHGMAVAIRAASSSAASSFSQLLAAMLRIDIDPLHLAKTFVTEDNGSQPTSPWRIAIARAITALAAAGQIQQMVALRRVEFS
jgi:hypothetical protein